jgi:Ca-activated chloride channel family protein
VAVHPQARPGRGCAVIRFGWPWALLLLASVPWVLRVGRRAGQPGLATLRSAAVALVVLALSGMQVLDRTAPVHVVFALDRSASVGPEQARAAEQFLREALRHRRPQDRVGLVTFGGQAVPEVAPAAVADLTPTQRPSPHHTDLGEAIRVSASLLPPSGLRRVVVLSDGQDHGGTAVEAARVARAAGVQVDTVPLLRPPSPEASVEAIQAPASVPAGERVPVRVQVASTTPQELAVELTVDGLLVDERRVFVAGGRSVVRFAWRAARPGWAEVQARVQAARDGVAANNVGAAVVRVEGPPAVLYAGSGRLPELLRAQGLRVERVQGNALPTAAGRLAPYHVVVLEDLPALALSRSQMEALRDYVRDLGGGLVVVGGPHAFGVGGYARTALEEALPVFMEVRHRVALPSMALVLVLDTSGSMGGAGTETAKVELAKEVARSVVELLGDHDRIGVIQFDQDYRWLVPLVPARERERIVAQVGRLRAGGGTDMLPALRAAYEALRSVQARVKHVIVLSDGQTDPGEFERWVGRMRAERITLTAVSVGKDADVPFMRSLARWGGGRHYLARDPSTLPQILVTEAFVSSRSYLVEGRFTPRQVPGDLLRGIPGVPPLRGYVATSPKPGAVVELSSGQRDPILAAWRYGLGRAVAFTSDAVPRWALEWQSWSPFARFWSQVVRWAMREDANGLQLHAEVVGSRLRIALDARGPAGEELDGLDVHARVVGFRRVQEVQLRQTAPGWYEGEAVLDESGTYTVGLSAYDGGRAVGQAVRPVVMPYPPELRDLEPDPTLLARVAEAGGGRMLRSPQESLAPPRDGRDYRDAWPLATAGAVGLFLLELVGRRVPVVAAWVRRWASGPAQPSEADRWYQEADRWKALAGPPPDADLEERARLYIARLKRGS